LAIPLRTPFKVSWVDIDKPEQGHTPGSHNSGGVVSQGVTAGGTLFIALEGCAWYQGSIFFTSKLGGAEKAGQVFQYDLATETLWLIFESPAHRVLSGPDNINFSPRGNLVICEDMVRAVGHSMRLVSLTKDGDYHFLAQINPKISGQVNGYNLAGLLPISEWAGVCFSADGQWMFVNIFSPGISLAITGPWHPLLA